MLVAIIVTKNIVQFKRRF